MCVCVSQEEEFRSCPRLDIIQPLPESCEEISSDALTVRNFQENECRDYRLGNERRDKGKVKSFTALNRQPQATSLRIPEAILILPKVVNLFFFKGSLRIDSVHNDISNFIMIQID